ncbi:MAG: hypothetical protein GTO24_01820 [candidate division Zixibacteria bacterium]|nr:hypothetical protein [candidate division Zixibacteria bacterium]
MREGCGGMMNKDRREDKRVPVDFPVFYRTQQVTVLGKAVNASRKGMMVESYIALETAGQILRNLAHEQDHRVDLQFTYKKKAYRPQAGLRHFHLDFSGKQPCRALAGFSLSKK